MSFAVLTRKKKKRKPHHHSRQARKVQTVSRSAVNEIVSKLSSPATAGLGTAVPAVAAYATSIAALRKTITGHTAGDKAARTGLEQLEHSVRLMGQAQATQEPAGAAELLIKSAAALTAAKQSAKRAGDAWPL